MPNKIGRFEILGELAHSEFCTVYKATDPDNGQMVALKAVKLEPLGDQAASLVQRLLEEAESTKPLNSPNLALLYGAGEMEGYFCASLEYVQGNSVFTALSRGDGFTIWDIQDITRQACQALDHAQGHKCAHYSLEPAKLMSGWDGTVKILGFGISCMGAMAAQAKGKAPDILYYMSPEQLHGDPLDVRSNLFSLGAILYEMATDRKAFDGDDADAVRQQILEFTPPAPSEVKAKVHPMLSGLIMKALAKDPEQRYQSGRELVLDLEKCKDNPVKADAKKTKEPARGFTGDISKLKAAAPAAVVASAPTPVTEPKIIQPAAAKPQPAPAPAPEPMVAQKSVAAAAGSNSSPFAGGASAPRPLTPTVQARVETPKPATKPPMELMSTLAVEEPEVQAPKIKVDPAMDENQAATKSTGKSFSEMSELPPLKEVFIAKPAPAPEPPPEATTEPDSVHSAVFKNAKPDKPKIQPAELAKKAANEIAKTPPKLFMYSIAGAIGIIALVGVIIFFHVHSENSEDDAGPAPAAAVAPATQAAAPAPQAAQASAPQPDGTAPASDQAQAQTAAAPVTQEPLTQEPPVSVQPKYTGRKKGKAAPPPVVAAVVIPGQLTLNSTPAGAQVQVDGQSNPAWVTPYNMAGIAPGSHVVVLSKPGYSTETRTIEVASGSKSFVAVQLASLAASIAITSDPAGASILIDGKDTGKVTPAQIAADKPGSHSFTLRKQGYLDDTSTANLQAGQTFRYAPTLRALGSADDVKIGGKFKKMFGGADTAGMGGVSIKTQPRGAQIAINNRILDKTSPVEFYLDPGTFVIDITLSGFQSVHKVITVEKGGKVAIDENLNRE